MRLTLRSSLLALAILGGFSSVVTAEPKLTVSFTSTQVGAIYAPLNVVAVWIEGPAVGLNPGPFVKTIGRWADVRKPELVAWRNRAGLNDVDAVSGATRQDHFTALTAEWDLKNKLGEIVPDGIYTIRMEMADGNSTAAAQNNQGTFTFTKGPAPELQMIPAEPPPPELAKWLDVTIDYNPVANECLNNIVDAGETCDGNCPVDCPVAADACAPNVLTGSAATCTAACAVQAVTTCVNADGCCAPGCGPTEDDDCETTGELSQSGCAAGSGGGTGALLAFSLVGLAFLFTRRRPH
jgi:uncharacterized protein (TIGR03382 family)